MRTRVAGQRLERERREVHGDRHSNEEQEAANTSSIAEGIVDAMRRVALTEEQGIAPVTSFIFYF